MRQQRNPQPIEAATQLALEGYAINDAGQRIIFDPSPEIDSVLERVAEFEQRGLPRHVLRPVIDELTQLLRLIVAERELYRRLGGYLDRASRVGAEPDLARATTVRGAVALLREPLAVLAENERHGGVDSRTLVQASGMVRRVAQVAPRRLLLSDSLRSKVGGRRHAALVRVLDALDGKETVA